MDTCRPAEILRRMYLASYNIKFKNKEESLVFMLDMYQKYENDGRSQHKEAVLLKKIIDAVQSD